MITNQKRVIDLTVEELLGEISKTVKTNLDLQAINSPNYRAKSFYTPKEFEGETGMKYSTVVHKCNTGKLKARQDGVGCSWQISADELDRFKKEATENL